MFAGNCCMWFLSLKIGLKTSVVIGLFVLTVAGLLFGQINLSISLVDIGLPNLLFGFGIVMAVTPLTNISCATLKNEQQTNASGVQNLVKNVGAAIGTSVATTMISRFSQVHQMMMIKSLTETNDVYLEKLNAYISTFIHYTDLSTATYMAKFQIYQILKQQTALWGYIETFRYYALASLIIIPFVCLLSEEKSKKT